MSRPLVSKNKQTLATQATQATAVSTGKINLNQAPSAVTQAPAKPVKKLAMGELGQLSGDKTFTVNSGQLTVCLSQKNKVYFKTNPQEYEHAFDENGNPYIILSIMPVNPSTGKGLAPDEIDLESILE